MLIDLRFVTPLSKIPQGTIFRYFVRSFEIFIANPWYAIHLLTRTPIAAIGVRVSKWIAYHGFAININNDLTKYQNIIPCGILDKGVTNLKSINDQNYNSLSDVIVNNFTKNLET